MTENTSPAIVVTRRSTFALAGAVLAATAAQGKALDGGAWVPVDALIN